MTGGLTRWDIDHPGLWDGIRQNEKSRSGFVYSRSSGAKQESAEYIQGEEDTGLAAVDGQGGAKGQGPDDGMKGPSGPAAKLPYYWGRQ